MPDKIEPTESLLPQRDNAAPETMEANGEQYEVNPEAEQEIASFEDNATYLIHSEETRDDILNELKAHQDKIKGVQEVSYKIFRKIEASREDEGNQLNEFTMVTGSQFIVDEIIEIGTVAGVVEKFTDQERTAAYMATVKKYVHLGVKEGRIDALELQKNIDPIAKEHLPKFHEFGLQEAEKAGITTGAG